MPIPIFDRLWVLYLERTQLINAINGFSLDSVRFEYLVFGGATVQIDML
jgi:hypothetical protein